MSWKKIISKIDFSEAQGRTNKKPKKEDEKKPYWNPFSDKPPPKGKYVDDSVPSGAIPANKCDGWTDCINDAVWYCSTCGYKACRDCYDSFQGHHPKAEMDGSDGNPPFAEAWIDDEDSEFESGRSKKKDPGYPNIKEY